MIDFTKLTKKQYKFFLRSAIHALGVNVDVYEKELLNNIYKEIEPEYDFGPTPIATIKVILSGRNGEGIFNEQFVSLIDRLDDELMIITDFEGIKEGQKLVLTQTDQRTINILVSNVGSVQSNFQHQYIRWGKVL